MTISNLATCLRSDDLHSHGSLVDKVSALIECLCHPGDGSGERLSSSIAAEGAFDASLKAEAAIANLLSRVVELERLVVTDELTELLNRRGIENELKRALSSAGRHNEQGVLIYIDLDGFKPVNDTFGHTAGDAVLCRVANILRDSVRDTDYVGRIGGDEFVVLMTRTYWQDGLSRSEVISKRLNESVLDWNDRQIAIKASIGMQNYGSGDTGHDLLKRADEAMYKTKRLRSDLIHRDRHRQEDSADTRRVANS
ncbi:MAG: GGDEF domain-containing protein [Alphaproteobacteria bacterium]